MGMMLLLFAQLLPHQLFAAIGSSFLDETRLSNRFLSAGKMPVGHTARMAALLRVTLINS